MKIIINETGKQETLDIVDQRTNVNYIEDFIGNTGALSDGQFTFDEESRAYHCDQDTFDWWAKVVADNQALENRIIDLRETYGSDRVQEVLNGVGDYELEDHAAAYNKELDEAFGTELGNV